MKTKDRYHYTESGLDNVFLESGYEYVDGGKSVAIHDVDGLQRAIGRWLVSQSRRLTAKEFRFLRSELLLSQASLAKILGLKELTVGRWERGDTEIPLTAEAVVRVMFRDSLGDTGQKHIKKLLEEIADLDDEVSQHVVAMRETRGRWSPASLAA